MDATVIERARPVPHDHLVHLYRTDDELDRAVRDHLLEGFRGDSSGLVIGTPARRERLEHSLESAGLIEALTTTGRYHVADARDTLEAFMVDGLPDPARFHATVGRVVARAAASGARLRAFGEMVALLWTDGNVMGAIELEALWNDLANTYAFSLYCAYPMAALEATDDLVSAQQVCTSHSDVIAPTPRASWPSNGDPQTALFAPSATSPSHARLFVGEVLTQWGCNALAPDAVLVTSELATNAVLHAHSVFRVSLELSSTALRIEVHDTDRTVSRQREAAPRDTSGRGVALVHQLSARAGTQVHATGKITWAELPRL